MRKLLYILPCFVLLYACKKLHKTYCEKHPEERVDIRNVKSFMYFDVGSWWLYEEEITHEKDCVIYNWHRPCPIFFDC